MKSDVKSIKTEAKIFILQFALRNEGFLKNRKMKESNYGRIPEQESHLGATH